jgi:MFS family permease
MDGFFAKERLVAGPGFNRWLIVVGGLFINLSVGSAYAFSVFNRPLTRLIGITQSAPDDWKLSTVGWVFTTAYVFLGLSTGFGGKWQDRVGPRVSGIIAALCFSSGFFISALGIWLHQIVILYLGYGMIGGCGLGLGYNTPVSPLIRWFPDRRGTATGIAIMGFGGGAIIAAPLSNWLMAHFSTSGSVGIAQTFLVLGSLYLCWMLCGALLFRLPAPGWRPPGALAVSAGPVAHGEGMPVETAVRQKQFYLIWSVLLLNVTAGIGVLGQASAMIQEVFEGLNASTAASFVALLSLFNMCGRLIWGSLSDVLGRKATYALFFSLGPLLYAAIPLAGQSHSVPLFVGCFAVIFSMYGGAFASMPAYVSDLFGPSHVGAIHGRVLTALSLAGVVGAGLVNYGREYLLAHGSPASRAYDVTMLIMAAFLVVGFFCNLAIQPVPDLTMKTAAPRISIFASQRLTASALGIVGSWVVVIFVVGLGTGWLLAR